MIFLGHDAKEDADKSLFPSVLKNKLSVYQRVRYKPEKVTVPDLSPVHIV